MLWKDWRIEDISTVELSLDKSYVYYMYSRAWALKGLLGGIHSWFAFWSDQHCKWLVAEITDSETLAIQNASIIYQPYPTAYSERAPMISDRLPNSKWFGATPRVYRSQKLTTKINDIMSLCCNYPFREFYLLSRNCNTFTSYIIYKLQLDMGRPLRAIGHIGKARWKKLIK